MLQGMTYAGCWIVVMDYFCSTIPSQYLATVRGILHGVYWGVGTASGNMIGGVLVARIGASRTFWIFSVMVFSNVLLFYFSQKVRTIHDLDKKEKVYSLCCVLALIAVLVLTIYRLAVVSRSDTDFTFAWVLLLNTAFCMFYIIHGILQERPYELIILSIATLVVWLYIIINYALGSKTPVKIARLVVATLASPVIISLGFLIAKQYIDSGRLIFRTIGANMDLQEICRRVFMYYALLMLDAQLALSMVILILAHPSNVDTRDIVILSVGGVIVFAWSVIGYLSVRRESKSLAIAFFIGFIFEPAYVIYKIITSAQSQNKNNDELAGTTYTCAALALVVRALLLVLYILVFQNFGHGFKEKVYATKEAPPATIQNTSENETA